jgi:hypothetical protein
MEPLRRIRQSLQKNKLLKRLGADRAILTICIGIAFVFWVLIKLSQTYTTSKTVRIEYVLPSDRAFATAPPADISIEIEGTGWDLLYDFLRSAKVHLSYNLDGMNRFQLTNARIRTDIKNQLNADDIKVLDIDFDPIAVNLETRAYKKLPVVLKGKIKYATGYFLRRPIQLIPDSIWVSGPSSKIGQLYELETHPIVLDELKTDAQQELELQTPRAEIRVRQQKIKVAIAVEQFTQKSIFVPVRLVNAAANMRVFPGRIKLLCSVGLSHFNELSSDDFDATVDLAGQRPMAGNNTAAVQILRQPLYVEHIRYSPHAVEFFEQKK